MTEGRIVVMTLDQWRIDSATETIVFAMATEAIAREQDGGSERLPRELAARRVGAWFSGVHGRQVLAHIARALEPSASNAAFFHDGQGRRTDAGHRIVSTALRGGRLIARRMKRAEPVALPPRSEATAPRAFRTKEPESITYPRWSNPRVTVGTELLAIVSYADIKAPVSATIVVSEIDDHGATHQEIARIATTIPTGTGDHKVKWRRSPDEAQRDLADDKTIGDQGPLEYRFKVESAAPKCTEESGPLWLTNTVKVDLVHAEDRRKLEHERIVVLTNAIGEDTRRRSSDGRVKFEDVLVGPIHVRVAEPRFTELAWSTQRAPVGEPVIASFAYSDAIKGMKVLVVVYEVNQDGMGTEVHREERTLAAPSGRDSVSFTRTEEEAEQDVEDDLLEGDTGPVEYRFTIAAEGRETERSNGLWLTHTVTVAIEDVAEDDAFPDGLDVVLLAADGTEHRAPWGRDEATFDGVVCGPMTVRLGPRPVEV